MELSRTVVKYLNSLGTHIRAVDACVIEIGGEERPAARYTQLLTPPAGARNPAPYESLRFYVLGRTSRGGDQNPRASTWFGNLLSLRWR